MGVRECCLTCRHAVHECDSRAGEIECYHWDETQDGQSVCDDYWSLLDRFHLTACDGLPSVVVYENSSVPLVRLEISGAVS